MDARSGDGRDRAEARPRSSGQTGASISSIDDDENGTVYLTDLQGGKLLKVSAKD